MTSIANEETMQRMQSQEKFNKLDYDFRFFYSLRFGEVKLSPNLLAFLTFPDRRLFILEDKEKCNKIFNDFLEFVKTAHNYTKPKRGLATGIITEVEWTKKPKYWLKKKPSADETREYLYGVLNENNLLDEKTKWENTPTTKSNIDEKLKSIVNDICIGNDCRNLIEDVYNIASKIYNLQKGTTTTIAKLIDYKPEVLFVEPIIQVKISRCVKESCKRIEIRLESNKDKIGGLAFFDEFTKI